MFFSWRRRVRSVHGSKLEGLVEAINERAWAERDLSPVLSDALISRIRSAHNESYAPLGRLIDELRQIAWEYRESDRDLSVIVLDMIARDGHKHLD